MCIHTTNPHMPFRSARSNGPLLTHSVRIIRIWLDLPNLESPPTLLPRPQTPRCLLLSDSPRGGGVALAFSRSIHRFIYRRSPWLHCPQERVAGRDAIQYTLCPFGYVTPCDGIDALQYIHIGEGGVHATSYALVCAHHLI